MVANLFDFLLALMQEQQFVGHLRISFLVLDRHVPNWQSIVLARYCNYRFLVGLESDGSDWFGMPAETEKFLLNSIWSHPQIPNFNRAIVWTSDKEVSCPFVPVTDINIFFMGIDLHLRLFVVIGSHVNYLQSTVRRTYIEKIVQVAKTKDCSGENTIS